MTLFLAIIIGFFFGAALYFVGALNPQNIIQMLRFKDLRLMKSILFAIGLAAVALFVGLNLGLVDVSHLSVKDTYIGVFVGGAIMGIGFAIAGYCPGTGLGAAATGRKDALFFVGGGFVGAFLYMIAYASIKATGLLDPILGGKVTVAATGSDAYPALLADGGIFMLAMGAVLMAVAYFLPVACPKCIK